MKRNNNYFILRNKLCSSQFFAYNLFILIHFIFKYNWFFLFLSKTKTNKTNKNIFIYYVINDVIGVFFKNQKVSEK